MPPATTSRASNDADQHGVFFLNSKLRPDEVTDGWPIAVHLPRSSEGPAPISVDVGHAGDAAKHRHAVDGTSPRAASPLRRHHGRNTSAASAAIIGRHRRGGIRDGSVRSCTT